MVSGYLFIIFYRNRLGTPPSVCFSAYLMYPQTRETDECAVQIDICSTDKGT